MGFEFNIIKPFTSYTRIQKQNYTVLFTICVTATIMNNNWTPFVVFTYIFFFFGSFFRWHLLLLKSFRRHRDLLPFFLSSALVLVLSPCIIASSLFSSRTIFDHVSSFTDYTAARLTLISGHCSGSQSPEWRRTTHCSLFSLRQGFVWIRLREVQSEMENKIFQKQLVYFQIRIPSWKSYRLRRELLRALSSGVAFKWSRSAGSAGNGSGISKTLRTVTFDVYEKKRTQVQ